MEPEQPQLKRATAPNKRGQHRTICPTCGARVSKRGRANEGPPSKATPERVEAVLADMGRGLTREQACAKNGCSHDQWQEWEKWPEFPTLRDEALAKRICYLLEAIEEMSRNKQDWRGFAWQLERVKLFRDQFADPSRGGIQINQQFNNGNSNPLAFNQAELEETRARLDRSMLREAKRKRGIATNAELREYYAEKIEEFQHLVECLDAGMTPDEETREGVV